MRKTTLTKIFEMIVNDEGLHSYNMLTLSKHLKENCSEEYSKCLQKNYPEIIAYIEANKEIHHMKSTIGYEYLSFLSQERDSFIKMNDDEADKLQDLIDVLYLDSDEITNLIKFREYIEEKFGSDYLSILDKNALSFYLILDSRKELVNIN